MSNRFRDKVLKREYDNAMAAYRAHNRTLFNTDGTRSKGNSIAGFFWLGYDGKVQGSGFVDRASRQMVGYAYWRAGQDARKADENRRNDA